MNQQGQYLLAIRLDPVVTKNPLAGTGLPFHHCINSLKMAGICREADPHIPIGKSAHTFVAQMILHVSIPGDQIRHVIGSKLVEYGSERLSYNLSQDIKPAPVRHPHRNLLHSGTR